MKRLLCLFLVLTCTFFVSCSSSEVSTDSSVPENETNEIDVETENETDSSETSGISEVTEETVEQADSTEIQPQETSENDIPVMSGIYLEDFNQITKQYDFDEYIDYDFEDGTFDRSYMNSNATMFLDIMYLPDTHEVMNGEIIPAVLCPKDLQESFIKDISQMLCPKNSAEEVTKWVEENFGKEAEIEIDGFIYELTFGAGDNIIYRAGVRNWEDWASNLN